LKQATTLTTSVRPVTPSTGVLRPLALTDVELSGMGFWGIRQHLNHDAVIPHGVHWVGELGWLANLENAADHSDQGEFRHRGREFADSEVYKLIEAMSWEYARSGRSSLDEDLDRFVDRVVKAQEPDGYLHTLFGRPWQRPRYSDFQWGHELYCFGHLIQAAVAHHRATGRDDLLKVGRRLADHVVTMFGEGGLNRVCGHAEIEVALVELYRTTGEPSYLEQARVFIERRGTGTMPLHEFGRAFWQDDMPVRDATVLRGHAVRALYLAAGAADVAVETGDEELLAALETQWENTVLRRTYITGGMGSHHMDEAFGEDHVLPTDRSYCETCAGVASIQFSWRLLLATGKPRYADLIERTLYNIVATSPARDGRSFFYSNTLHQRVLGAPAPMNDDGVCIRGGSSGRQPWFEVSCCPPNFARLIASLSAYVATSTDRGVQIHQYAAGRIRAELNSDEVVILDLDTDYPASGLIRVTVREAPDHPIDLKLRVPEWADSATGTVNGESSTVESGWWSVRRTFAPNETLEMRLPMQPRYSYPDERIDAVRGTVAIERGPVVLALESVDMPSDWSVNTVRIDTSRPPSATDGTTVTLVHRAPVSPSSMRPASVTQPFPAAVESTSQAELVPYYDWANRGPSTMRIWIPIA
jgi:uncharacterized protein